MITWIIIRLLMLTLKAKKEFFDNLSKDAFALINVDDKNGMVMVQNCKANNQYLFNKKYGRL